MLILINNYTLLIVKFKRGLNYINNRVGACNETSDDYFIVVAKRRVTRIANYDTLNQSPPSVA